MTVTALGHRFADLELENAILSPLGCRLVNQPQLDRDDPDRFADLQSSDAVLLGTGARLDAALLRQLHGCRVVVRYGIGVDNIDLRVAEQLGIVVCNVPDYCVEEVATHALALALALQRGLPAASRHLRETGWVLPQELAPSRPSSVAMGVLGLGKIGRAAVRLATAAFGRVLVFDPYAPRDVPVPDGVIRVGDVNTLLDEADIVTLHCPLTPSTYHLIDAEAIAHMRQGALLINVSRGGLIDEAALLSALDAGRLGGAGLDVFESEPPAADDPLLTHPAVLATPHSAWRSVEAARELRTKAAEEVARVLRGDPPRSPVTARGA